MSDAATIAAKAAALLRDRIADGYLAPTSKTETCVHGRYNWEDCIACYDEALETTAVEIASLAPSTQLQTDAATFHETGDSLKVAALTRPIIGIENRTAQEAFDIMVDRIRSHFKDTDHG